MDFQEWQKQNPQAVASYKAQLAEYQRVQTLPYLHMAYIIQNIFQQFHFQAEVPIWQSIVDSKGKFILKIGYFTKKNWDTNPMQVTKEIEVGDAKIQELGVIDKETIVTDKPVEEVLKEKGIEKDKIGEYHETEI